MKLHWLTTYDPETGDPVGSVCNCPINHDHNGAGEPDWEEE